ncbi:MAG: pantoate--beta-alanine ligase [Thiomicrospira sp.]|uniref:pantoate--beta-alanine ligase n=1 Tax=Thiomicrospira sp. TaxID=935 RepID=UPI0019E95158|nr:pantoate--beta-alanine ligase [Thiomicrospira sp.]MBE0494127.1 pantoate--beta-alanine ligase [Thiomicrospira sp.]
MIELSSIQALRHQVAAWKQAGLRVGFVPTMGNLHAGHLSLIERASQQAERVISSVFVNPLQFGEGEDFERYPRTLAEDVAKLNSVNCDALFVPSVNEMYGSNQAQTQLLAAPSLTQLWEGASRPGHFDGVATVVAKLFNLVQPDLAVFGQKDYQQWCVLQQMVADLNWPIELIKAPIKRDSDGLALSSRNQFLNEKQRKIAPGLYLELQKIAHDVTSAGRVDFAYLEQEAIQNLLRHGFDQVDYVALVDPVSLQKLTQPQDKITILAAACLGSTRLLDNIELDLS